MLFSVIIPTCNRNNLLSKCLDLLAPKSQTIDSSLYEVIVTDDSKDNVAKVLIEENYPWAKWVEGPKRGPASNRNNGAKKVNGEWLVFIDDDCLPETNIFQEYQRSINSNPKVVAFEGRIFTNTCQTTLLDEAPINDVGGNFWSCNICVSKRLFTTLGGFDEKFPFAAMEDVDFFYRLKKVTCEYKFVYKAAVMHPWRTNKNLFKITLERYKSQLYFKSKHGIFEQKLNAKFYFVAFFRFIQSTLKNSWKLKFRGFATKILSDFLQLYFAFRSLFSPDKFIF